MSSHASPSPSDPALALVSFALAPGPGGAEAEVTRQFAMALGAHWQGPLTAYSAGQDPCIEGVLVHAEQAAQDLTRSDRRWRRLRDQAAASRWSIGRVVSRMLYERSGYTIKYHAWERWVGAQLATQLDADPSAVVVSRALPLCSLSAAHRVLAQRPHRWIANLNDPCPPGVWPGLYPLDARTQQLQARTFDRLLNRIDAFTFPSRRLFELHAEAYPVIRKRPVRIVPRLPPPLPREAPFESSGAIDIDTPGALRIGFAGSLRHYLPNAATLDALARVNSRSPIEIHAFATQSSPALQRLAEQAACPVFIQAPLSGEQIDQQLYNVDVLLCLEAEIDRPLLLTKLVSYLRFRKPILAMCPEAGTTWELLERMRVGTPVPFDQVDQIEAALQLLVDQKQSGTLRARAPSEPQEPPQRFRPAVAASALRALIDDIDQRRVGLQGESWP